MEILLGILLIITIAAVIVAVVAIFYDGVGSLLWFAIAFVIFFIYSSSYSAYYTTYESSIETAIVTDKEDGKLYFRVHIVVRYMSVMPSTQLYKKVMKFILL